MVGIEYGSVEVVIHDGKVVQIEEFSWAATKAITAESCKVR